MGAHPETWQPASCGLFMAWRGGEQPAGEHADPMQMRTLRKSHTLQTEGKLKALRKPEAAQFTEDSTS